MKQIKFKETEIGKIPEDWEVKELREVLQKKGYIRGPFGSALRRPELKSKGIPVYEQVNAIYNHRDFRFFIDEDKYKELKRFTVEDNDLIVSCSGTFGKVSIIQANDTKGIISQALLILRPDVQKINPHFLKYFFISDKGYHAIASRSLGSVQVNIAKREVIEKIELALPNDRNEQNAIVKILEDIDSKIELNQQMNKTLEAIGQALFKRWFVDFEFPNEEGKPYKSSGGEMADSELGEIPKGWCIGILKDCFNITMGQSPPGTSYNGQGEGIMFFQGRTDFGFRYPDERMYCTAPTRFAGIGDTLVSVRAPVGDINMALEKCCIGRGLSAVRHKKGFRSYTYYSMLFLQNIFRSFESDGTVFGSISKGKFENISVIIPQTDTVKEFEKRVYALDERIERNEQQSRVLTTIRDSLLPRLMSGRIRVIY